MNATASDPFQAALGPLHTVQLSAGPLRYRDLGAGIPALFLAGSALPSGFWRRVVPALRQPVRPIVPDLPLGAHTVALRRDADLSPPAIADLLVELLDALNIEEAVIVGNDTGGAIAKLLATRHPERVGALVRRRVSALRTSCPRSIATCSCFPTCRGRCGCSVTRCASRRSAGCRSPSAGSPNSHSKRGL